MGKRNYFAMFIQWRVKNLPDTIFLILLSIIIGLLTGLAAFVLKETVYGIENRLMSFYNSSQRVYLFLIYPLIFN
jgi:CIC family chloride channel protein